MSMKITNRNSRNDRAGKHNDRNFNLDDAPHIDKSRVHLNKYWTYNGDDSKTFVEIEKEFYEQHFSAKIEKQNKKNDSNRHSERNKTVEDYFKGKFTKPEDKILQVGNYFEHISGDELWECALQYAEEFDKRFGDHCKIVDMALHMDEATPHVHIRRVWIAEDEQGDEFVSENKALEQLGFEIDEDKKSIRTNSKTTFTAVENEIFRDICKSRNLDLDLSNAKPNQKHKNLDVFKLENISKLEEKERELLSIVSNLEDEQNALKMDVDQLKQEVEDQIDPALQMFYDNAFLNQFGNEMAEIKKEKDKIKQIRLLMELFKKKSDYVFKGDYDLTLIRNSVEKELSLVKDFLEKYKLIDEFNEYIEDNRNNEELQKSTIKDIVRE